jgi:O-antigen/teichoic acid export membrane protein
LLPYSIAFIILPKITPQEDVNKAHSISQYFRFTLYLSLILAVGVALFIKPVVVLLFGQRFLLSAETILIILPGLICWALVTILGQYFAATSYNIKIIVGWLLAFLLNIVLNYLYIPQFGMKAAAVTSDIAYLFILIYIFILFKKETKVSLKSLLKPLPYDFKKTIIY